MHNPFYSFPQYGSWSLNDQLNNFSWSIDLYNDFVLFVESMISMLIILALIVCVLNKFNQKFLHWENLEIFWSVLPAFLLIFMGIPTLKILHNMESLNNTFNLNVKIMGHQWYWEYNFPELEIKIESYPTTSNIFRMLETSSTLVLPINCNIQMLITSYDVIHSWTLPSLGVKMDACPGRINFFMLNNMKPGIYIGQCSELCGNFHHLMPIYMESISMIMFKAWLKTIYS